MHTLTIDGRSIDTESTFDVINPATAQVFAQCPLATTMHVNQAVAAAKIAFVDWSQADSKIRQQKMHEIADMLEAHNEELMELITMEQGKPLVGYQNIGSGMEVGGAVAWTRVTADLELPVEVIQDNDEARIEVHRKPLGVIGSITPWNWPLMIAIWHVIPALRAGNTVVIKPSSNTPLSTLRFVELANQILPAGVLNVVTGGSAIGNAITAHPGISKIVFTGSTETGKQIMHSAADNLKRLTLELGGNDAGIVLSDVNPRNIAPQLFAACFNNNGQTCAALKRLYVHEDIYDELCNELVNIAKNVKTGDGMKADSGLGPVQNKAQFDYICELAEDAKRAGARILTGGAPIKGSGYFYPVTLVADISDGTRLVDEEPFGPILPIIKYSNINDAIQRANNSANGLGGSVWSNNIELAQQLANRLECGTAWINNHAAIQPDAPFGGVKESGFGVEFGRWGLEENTSIQTIKISK